MHNSCRSQCRTDRGDPVEKAARPLCDELGRPSQQRLRGGLIATRLVGGLLACLIWIGGAAAQTAVDLELVVAVDVSLSMDLDEQRLQREGYVAAFRDREVQKVIASGGHGRIAVVYMEWAGPQWQSVIIPWTIIDSPEAARAFADRLEAQPISRERWTFDQRRPAVRREPAAEEQRPWRSPRHRHLRRRPQQCGTTGADRARRPVG